MNDDSGVWRVPLAGGDGERIAPDAVLSGFDATHVYVSTRAGMVFQAIATPDGLYLNELARIVLIPPPK